MRWFVLAGIVAGLGLLAPPATADDPVVYTGCLKTSNGSLYNVREGTTPMAPCHKHDKQISWNMAGQPGPEGPPGPSLPRQYDTYVDCEAGESINDALAVQAEIINIAISGTCREQVRIRHDHVALFAQDPDNPPILIHDDVSVVVDGARDVWLHDLKFTGSGRAGLLILNSEVRLANGEIWNKMNGVEATNLSNVAIDNFHIHDNGGGGIQLEGGSHLHIQNSVVERNGAGIGGSSSRMDILYTTILDNNIGIRQDRGGTVRTEGGVVSGSNEGLVLNTGSAAELNGTTFTQNRSVGIGGEGSVSVKLYGGVTVSDNPGGGIGLSNGASLAFRGTNSITGNGVGIAMFNSSFHAFSAGEMRVFGNGAGISCTLTSGACVPGDITDSISGCGTMCPEQPDQP